MNAHLRFGWLTYYKMTERTTTTFKLRLDRFIGEVLPDPPRQAKAHLVSVIGGDTQIAAVNAAISMGERFLVEGPNVPSILACLDRNAQCYKGALQLSGRKKPLRHLIGISEELAGGNATPGRTLLASSNPEFVWASLAQIYGLPGTPEWAEWFHSQLTKRKSMTPLLGVGCAPISVRGDKAQFLKWLSAGLRSRQIAFPETHGPILWPGKDLAHIFQPATALTA